MSSPTITFTTSQKAELRRLLRETAEAFIDSLCEEGKVEQNCTDCLHLHGTICEAFLSEPPVEYRRNNDCANFVPDIPF